jgi:hypothetical protein
MGWSEDLLAAGLIDEEEYEYLKELGYDSRHYGNVEALEDLIELAYQYGLDELGDRLTQDYFNAIDYYEEKLDYTAYYDHSVDRWRDVETGRFVPDPYEWVRD